MLSARWQRLKKCQQATSQSSYRSRPVCHIFPTPTQSAKGRPNTVIAYPHVGFTRNYSASGLSPRAVPCYGFAGATCGSVNGSVRCTIPSAYNPSISVCDRPSMVERISVVSSPIDGAPRQMRPGVSDIFGTTPKTRIGNARLPVEHGDSHITSRVMLVVVLVAHIEHAERNLPSPRSVRSPPQAPYVWHNSRAAVGRARAPFSEFTVAASFEHLSWLYSTGSRPRKFSAPRS